MTGEPPAWQGRLAALATALVMAAAPAAAAQQSVNEVLSFLVTNQAVVTDDFVKDLEAAAATRDTVSRLLQVELATLPVSSSTGGFLYRFNPSIGTMERASDSFGPFFLERALTSGRGQTSLGFAFRHTRFDTLDGRPLRDGTLVTTANRLADEPEPFDVEALSLQLDASTFTVFGSYGATDRLDVSAAIPVVTLALSGERLNVYRGTLFQQATASAIVTGLADVALRAKYSVAPATAAGLAAAVEVSLPTGAKEQLLGSGRLALRGSAIASLESPRVGAHFTAGAGTGGVSNELHAGAAVVFAATSHLNLIGEVFGRRMSELVRIEEATAPHPLLPNVSTTRLLPGDAGTNTVLAVAGFKWNIAGTWLLHGSVLVPLTDTGLTGRPTPSLALDYTFDRR